MGSARPAGVPFRRARRAPTVFEQCGRTRFQGEFQPAQGAKGAPKDADLGSSSVPLLRVPLEFVPLSARPADIIGPWHVVFPCVRRPPPGGPAATIAPVLR